MCHVPIRVHRSTRVVSLAVRSPTYTQDRRTHRGFSRRKVGEREKDYFVTQANRFFYGKDRRFL